MLFIRLLLILVISCTCVIAHSKPNVVDLEGFQTGDSWTWSYSEQDLNSGLWQDPYLFETYQVVARKGSLVTIEISSNENKWGQEPAHHRFVVDLDDCVKASHSLRKLLKLKIEFYTKTRSKDWQLVSKRHDGLAFTEKFNCYDGPITFKESQNRILGEFRVIAQWLTIPLQSFYIADGSVLRGVAAQRRSRNYLMLLDSVNLN